MISWQWGAKLDENAAAPDNFRALNVRMKRLEQAIDAIIGRISGVTSFPNGDLTPSVERGHVFLTANTVATTITDFDNAEAGHTFVLMFGDNNTTIQHLPNIVLKGGVNLTGVLGQVLIFTSHDGNEWRETPNPS